MEIMKQKEKGRELNATTKIKGALSR